MFGGGGKRAMFGDGEKGLEACYVHFIIPKSNELYENNEFE